MLLPRTPWATKASELASRNKHFIPIEKIKRMLEDFDKVDSKLLFEQCNSQNNLKVQKQKKSGIHFLKTVRHELF
jgi:hypothetical protein